jgi:hypothetical protein
MFGNKNIMILPCSMLFSLLFLGMCDARGADESVLLWDTAKHFEQSLAPEAVAKKEGWKGLPGENESIAGDPCLVNKYLALVLRKGARSGEWYYKLGDKMVKGPTLIPIGANGDKAKRWNPLRSLIILRKRFFWRSTPLQSRARKSLPDIF